MGDVYTPTKTMDGNIFSIVDGSPAVYVPTPIEPSTSSDAAKMQNKLDDQSSRQKYGAVDHFTTANKTIRIVKRKPKVGQETTPAQPVTPTLKRRATEDGEEHVASPEKTGSLKGILRTPLFDPNRERRRICFADSKNLPLCHIKEIERIAAIHSNVADFRCSEKNEFAASALEVDDFEDAEWHVVKIKKCCRAVRKTLSESGKVEEQRIAAGGVMRAAMFGNLECNPILNDMAAKMFLEWQPIIIPTESKPAEPAISALHDLPMPGRYRQQPHDVEPTAQQPQAEPAQQLYTQQPNVQPPAALQSQTPSYEGLLQIKYPQPGVNLDHLQQHLITRTPYNQFVQDNQISQPGTVAQSTASAAPQIQQIFHDSQPMNNYYTATTSAPQTSAPASATSTESRFELPSNLKEMLNKLKAKGFVSSEDSSTTTPATQEVASPLAAAMQTAQKLLRSQELAGGTPENTYSSEESPPDYPMDGYVATFATPEMMAQERRQDSQNSEGWTQSGWKIQEPCVYFINRPGGCNRGEQCRFTHDEELVSDGFTNSIPNFSNTQRRQKMAELPARGSYHHRDHDDRNFRGGDRRGRGRGGNYGNRNNSHNQDHDFRGQHPSGRDHRDGHPQRTSRFGDTEGRGGQYNRGGGFNRSRFDKKGDFNSHHHQNNQYQQHQQSSTASQVDLPSHDNDGPSPPKRSRISRFDKSEGDSMAHSTGDHDHRPQRKSRFDNHPPRSRFDQSANDRDDRNPQYYNV
ncbi:CRE-ZFP-3 protein [Caenorhabditis remanei]|uniref:CRE-ZFP-3 protein n=1 Tax=Caenorhabditis remanei TaxID=31234 RepID=E3NFI6_CAERE|nr:CRE-ZFP-3 protein [Caenorhabditis remanei]